MGILRIKRGLFLGGHHLGFLFGGCVSKRPKEEEREEVTRSVTWKAYTTPTGAIGK